MKQFAIIVAVIVFVVAVWVYWDRYRVDPARAEILSDACLDWFEEDIYDGTRPTLGRAWRKRGAYVFEMLEPQDGGGYLVSFCIADPDEGRLRKPGLFDMANWR